MWADAYGDGNRDFSQNYFKDYPVKFSHDTMETLNLSTNALTACSGNFPNMTNLYELFCVLA